ncbi:MAG: hypothetical protein J0L99_21255 [Chitinophagales bacterium]|nr:hypothetical protein [Chitinophagales bacterium]
MKNYTLPLLAAFLMLLFTQCHKYPDAILPESVELGQSVIFMNAEKTEVFKPKIERLKTHPVINFQFAEYRNDSLIQNTFSFLWIPIRVGEYALTTDKSGPKGEALCSFGQRIDDDLPAYEYKLVDAQDGYFHLETLDTVNQIVSGRFRAKFKRTDRNGNRNMGLDKHIIFEGVFHEHYTFY